MVSWTNLTREVRIYMNKTVKFYWRKQSMSWINGETHQNLGIGKKNYENKSLSKINRKMLLNSIKIPLNVPGMKRIWKIKMQELSRESWTRIIRTTCYTMYSYF